MHHIHDIWLSHRFCSSALGVSPPFASFQSHSRFFPLCVALEEVSKDNCCRSFPMVSFASLLKFHNAIRASDPSVMVTPQHVSTTSKYMTDDIEIDDE